MKFDGVDFFTKICPETLDFVTIGHKYWAFGFRKYRALYVKTTACFCCWRQCEMFCSLRRALTPMRGDTERYIVGSYMYCCVSMVTIVTRTRHSVTLHYIACLLECYMLRGSYEETYKALMNVNRCV